MQLRHLRFIFAVLLLCSAGMGTVALASDNGSRTGILDIGTMNTVISRLEQTVPDMHNAKVKARIFARLGDLHSDRARLRGLDEVKSNCKTCHGAKDDRQIAIRDYTQALALNQKAHGALAPDQSAEILTQTAYLFSLEGETSKAKGVYSNIIDHKDSAASSQLIGEAYAGRGELYFRDGDFKKAQRDYSEALRYPLRNEGLVQYRLAWCEFNEGHTHQARVRLTNELKTAVSPNEPISFRHDMARDLVTFVAREPITKASIAELMSVTPASDRAANLFYLGQEADRLGNKTGALLVWNFYSQSEKVTDANSLEMQVRTAQALWDEGRTTDGLRLYQSFLKKFAAQDCSKLENCDVLTARSRRFVMFWLKRDKLHPTSGLLSALASYDQVFTDDSEIIQWTGHIARRMKQYAEAAGFYHLAADSSDRALRDKKTDPKKRPQLQRILEGSLLAEIECAEQTNDANTRSIAYQHYMALQPNGPKQNEVRYQIAYLKYQAHNYKDSSNEFHDIALAKPTGGNIAESLKWQDQAAHLSLDALSQLNQPDQVEAWADQYARIYPQDRNDFYGAARRASVDSAVAQSQAGQNQQALAKLEAAPLVGATTDEKANVLKNEIILAKKLGDVSTVAIASYRLEQTPHISRKDRKFAYEHELWASEMKMDFRSSFVVAKKLKIEFGQHNEDQLLQLALLAELSGHNAAPYYRDFLKHSHHIAKANLIRAKMVRESRNPWRTLNEYRRELRRTPEIYGAAVLDSFARDRNVRELPRYLHDRSIRRSSQYEALSRYYELAQDQILDHKLRRARGITPYRVRLLHQAERLANVAVHRNDFVLEIVNLNRLSREYSRLAWDLSRTPTPRHLKFRQRLQYRRLMNLKIAQYKNDAKNIAQQLNSLWSRSNALDALTQLSQSDLGIARRLVVRDLETIISYAPRNQRSKIIDAISYAEANPNRRQIAQARAAVLKNPFDLGAIADLKKLESRRGDTSMVVFLDARLAANNTIGTGDMKKGTL